MIHQDLIILVMVITIFLVRSFAFIFTSYSLPKVAKEALNLLPPAIITTILADGIFVPSSGNGLNLSLLNPFLISSIIAIIITLRVNNLFVAIFGSYVCYLVLLHFLPIK